MGSGTDTTNWWRPGVYKDVRYLYIKIIGGDPVSSRAGKRKNKLPRLENIVLFRAKPCLKMRCIVYNYFVLQRHLNQPQTTEFMRFLQQVFLGCMKLMGVNVLVS